MSKEELVKSEEKGAKSSENVVSKNFIEQMIDKDLAEGVLPPEYTVLCRKNAGYLFGLCLMDENIEDFKDNRTHFCLFQLKNPVG